MARLCALFFLLGLLGPLWAQKAVTERQHLWLRQGIKANMGSGYYLLTLLSSRYNLGLQKRVDGQKTTAPTIGWFINEIYLGPGFGTKLSANISIASWWFYRPMLYYVDEKTRDKVVRQTTATRNAIYLSLGRFSIFYRLAFWYRGNQGNFSEQMLNRHMVGIKYSVSDSFKLILAEEMMLDLLAESSQGRTLFYRNYVWAGFDYVFSKTLNLRTRYSHFYTIAKKTATSKSIVIDHYLLLTLNKSFNL